MVPGAGGLQTAIPVVAEVVDMVLSRAGRSDPVASDFFYVQYCFAMSPWRPHTEDKRMVLEYTHGLFIT